MFPEIPGTPPESITPCVSQRTANMRTVLAPPFQLHSMDRILLAASTQVASARSSGRRYTSVRHVQGHHFLLRSVSEHSHHGWVGLHNPAVRLGSQDSIRSVLHQRSESSLRAAQGVFDDLAFADVPQNGGIADDLALHVPKRRNRSRPRGFACRPSLTRTGFMTIHLLAADQSLQTPAGFAEPVGRYNPRNRLADHLAAPISQHALRARVPIGNDPIKVMAMMASSDDSTIAASRRRSTSCAPAHVHFFPQRVHRASQFLGSLRHFPFEVFVQISDGELRAFALFAFRGSTCELRTPRCRRPAQSPARSASREPPDGRTRLLCSPAWFT